MKGSLEGRARQAKEVGRTDQEGLQGDVGRHLEVRGSEIEQRETEKRPAQWSSSRVSTLRLVRCGFISLARPYQRPYNKIGKV